MSPQIEIPKDLHRLLEWRPIAFVTTMRPDGRMSTNPMALIFDGKTIRLSTTTNKKKYRNLMADDRITICVVQPNNLSRYVEIRGRAIVEPDVGREFINHVMTPQYMDTDTYPFDKPGDERVVITVLPEAISSPPVDLADDPPYMKPRPDAPS